MSIVLFTEITTEQYLVELEAEAITYQGLYVDMEIAEQRKHVKDKASLVNGLLKKLDRARIDKSREYKKEVESEAGSIRARLEAVNLPFTLLIDEHKAERQKVLDAKKVIEDAKALFIQIELDHDEALLLNKVFAFERAEANRLQDEREQVIRSEATEQATKQADERARLQAEQIENKRLQKEAGEKAEIARRESDTKHKREVNKRIVSNLMIVAGVSEEAAKLITIAIAKNQISNVTINY